MPLSLTSAPHQVLGEFLAFIEEATEQADPLAVIHGVELCCSLAGLIDGCVLW